MAVSEALVSIGAALDTLAENLDGSVEERVVLLGELEGLRRRAGVVSAELTVGLFDEEISALGGAPHKVIADWLRITPAEARRRNRAAEPLQPAPP